MIITIKGADFSLANIGTLSTYIISKSIGRGASFDIPSFVEKNSSVNWVITLGEDYTFGTYSVTMGGEVVTPTVNGGEMTIAIANVTGNIRISVATVNENTGEEDDPVVPPVTPDEPEIPDSGEWRLYDSFNRADTTSATGLGTMDSGHMWERYDDGKSWMIISNNKATTSSSGYPSALCRIGSGDRSVESVVNFAGTGQILLYSRFDKAKSTTEKGYYAGARINSDGLSLVCKSDGINNTIVQTIPLNSLPQMPILLRIDVEGDTHNVYVDNELVMSQDITNFADAKYVGIQVTSGNYADDFKGKGGNPNVDGDIENGEGEGSDSNIQSVDLIIDSFDRDDTTTGLGTSDSGYEWEYFNNGKDDSSKLLKISNNKAVSIEYYPSALCNLSGANKTIESTINASKSGQVLIFTRYDKNTGANYVAVRAKNDGLTLLKKIDSINTEIQTIPMSGLPTYPFNVKVEVNGDTHNVYVNDEMLMSHDITDFADKLYVGFSINGDGNYVDSFRAEITE